MFRSLCKLVLLAGCLFDSAALRANNLITTVLNPILKEAVEDYADHPLLWVPLSLSAHRSVNAGLTPRAKAPVKAKPRRTRRPAAEAEFPARSSCCSWCFWLLEVAGFVSWFVCVRESEGGCVCVCLLPLLWSPVWSHASFLRTVWAVPVFILTDTNPVVSSRCRLKTECCTSASGANPSACLSFPRQEHTLQHACQTKSVL